MSDFLVLLVILGACWLMFVWEGQKPQAPPPVTREHVVAKVLLHQARRRREVAELERDINESANQRLSDLHRDDWLER